ESWLVRSRACCVWCLPSSSLRWGCRCCITAWWGASHMSDQSELRDDPRLGRVIRAILRIGVLLAALVPLLGGALSLMGDGRRSHDDATSHGEPMDLRRVSGIAADAFMLHSRAIIQLGILLLIGTPIARVLFSLLAFALQRDLIYVVVTLLVLAVLVYGMVGGNF